MVDLRLPLVFERNCLLEGQQLGCHILGLMAPKNHDTSEAWDNKLQWKVIFIAGVGTLEARYL